MRGLISHLRYTIRLLLKTPGFTVTAVLILGNRPDEDAGRMKISPQRHRDHGVRKSVLDKTLSIPKLATFVPLW
jgi:hypothetical protein